MAEIAPSSSSSTNPIRGIARAIGNTARTLVVGRPPNYEGSRNAVRGLRKEVRHQIGGALSTHTLTPEGADYAIRQGVDAIARTLFNGIASTGILSFDGGALAFGVEHLLRNHYSIDLFPDVGNAVAPVTDRIAERLPHIPAFEVDLSRATGSVPGALAAANSLFNFCCLIPSYSYLFPLDTIRQIAPDLHHVWNAVGALSQRNQNLLQEYQGDRSAIDEAAVQYGAILHWPDRTAINTNTLTNSTPL